MKKQYIKPTIFVMYACPAQLMAGSEPMLSGSVKDNDGNGVEGGDFGYGGDGSDGDESDAKFNNDWGSIW